MVTLPQVGARPQRPCRPAFLGSQPGTGTRLPAWLEFCLLTDVGQCPEHPPGKLPEGHFLVLTSC